eukprot:GFUD01021876.1.p1 GENE.GFUD01021876.1~~GFUD01021876.1.p1  ORF type:complete len:228 (-),score=64.63 GFUD01021876.1:255-938(-)
MAGILAGNDVEQEYLWSCTLSGSDKEYSWAPEDPTTEGKEDEENDGNVKPGHRLLIKSAILMPSAKKDEVTIVQIESEGYNKKTVIVPICAMKGGSDYQQYVDLLVPTKAKFSLLQGKGPIHFLGSHCVDFSGFRDVEAGDSEEEDEATEDDVEMEEDEKAVKEKGDKKETPTKESKVDEKADKKTTPKEDKKRKASAEQAKSEEKKKKVNDPVGSAIEKAKKSSAK